MRLLIVLLLVPLLNGCASKPGAQHGRSVLFVGNSLTYTNNLPAVFSALAEANGQRVSVEMLVAGGARLSDFLENHAFKTLTSGARYHSIVLQEKGGVLSCYEFSRQLQEECTNSRSAHREMANMIRGMGARSVLLGTYQLQHLAASERLQANEAAVACASNIDKYLRLSELVQKGRKEAPSLNWLHPDGGHPGEDLTLLMAVLIYHGVFEEWPTARDFGFESQVYDPNTHFEPDEFARNQNTKANVLRRNFDGEIVGRMIELSKGGTLESCW